MKSLILPALLREQFKRFWAISALTMLFYLLFVFLPIYSDSGHSQVRSVISLLNGESMALIAVFLSPFLAVIPLFSYLFSSNSTTFFHALPASKNQLLFTNMLAGLVLILVPLLILSILLLIPIHTPMAADLPEWARMPSIGGQTLAEGELINTFSRVAQFFLHTAIIKISIFTLFVLAANLAGTLAIAVLLCVFVPFLPILIHFIIDYFLFDHFSFPRIYRAVLDDIMDIIFGFHILRTLLVLPAIYYCYHRRKLERTGDAIVFYPVKNFLVFLFSIYGMVLMGISFHHLLGSDAVYIGFVLGFLLTFIVLQMIMEKTFQIRHKLKSLPIFTGIAAAGYLGLLIIYLFT